MPEPITIAVVVELLGKAAEYLRDGATAKDRDFNDWLVINRCDRLRNILQENLNISKEMDDIIRGHGFALEMIQRDIKQLLELARRGNTSFVWMPKNADWSEKKIDDCICYSASLPVSVHGKGKVPKVTIQGMNSETGAWRVCLASPNIDESGNIGIVMQANPMLTSYRFIIDN